MTEVVGVRFKSAGKVYYFGPGGNRAKKGDRVIVETARGQEMGECVLSNFEVDDDKVVKPLREVLRLATEDDMRRAEENRKKERQALISCQEKVNDHKLDMKIVDVEFAFDGSKVLFYFTADGRIDFRELVKDLASLFRARIELRQIGVRDEAKMIGGLGICGREFCCTAFLDEFHPVSIKMAKEQSLSLNPTKISGSCGRLMCCLKYEQEAYTHLLKIVPPKGSLVATPEGDGTVVDVNLLRKRLRVRIDKSGDDADVKDFPLEELKLIRSGKVRKPSQASEKKKPPKESKEPKESREPKEPREPKQPKQPREPKESKGSKDSKPKET